MTSHFVFPTPRKSGVRIATTRLVLLATAVLSTQAFVSQTTTTTTNPRYLSSPGPSSSLASPTTSSTRISLQRFSQPPPQPGRQSTTRLLQSFSNNSNNKEEDEDDDDDKDDNENSTTTTTTFPRARGGDLSRNAAFWRQWTAPEWTEFEPTSMLDNWKAIRDNVLQGTKGQRGELYVICQFVLLVGIATGSLPLLLPLLRLVVGPTLFLGGLATCWLVATRLGKALSPWPVPTDNSILFTDGFYGVVRHPIYSGLLATCLGLSLVTESMYRLLLTAVLYYVLDLKSSFEEKSLLDKYGVVYEDYQTTVSGKLVPQRVLDYLPPWTSNESVEG
mmetsp:Transcript_812/g.2363  ORF Transcript_812/g.2363 Transcript_812/m.2363 type:complete len:333 (-) Transcript_812:69-1067(-)